MASICVRSDGSRMERTFAARARQGETYQIAGKLVQGKTRLLPVCPPPPPSSYSTEAKPKLPILPPTSQSPIPGSASNTLLHLSIHMYRTTQKSTTYRDIRTHKVPYDILRLLNHLPSPLGSSSGPPSRVTLPLLLMRGPGAPTPQFETRTL